MQKKSPSRGLIKVVTPKEMRELENQAFQQGISEEKFMEQAGIGIAKEASLFVKASQLTPTVTILAGKGNNAGDAFVAGFHLLKKGFCVNALQPSLKQLSPLCLKNQKRFLKSGGQIFDIKKKKSLFPSEGIILDGLFGTGFQGEVKEPFLSLIEQANVSNLPILSIDIPSGLNGETGEVTTKAIKATQTLFLGLPKLGFFLREGWNRVGTLHFIDFGLPKKIIDHFSPSFLMITSNGLKPLLPPIIRTRHKYQAGCVIGIAGSPGMPGAALLASLGALRGGAGIVKLLYPKGMEGELAHAPYELLKTPYEEKDLPQLKTLLETASSTFIGPGIGRSLETKKMLKKLLPCLKIPSVLDADALNLIAEENIPLPPNAILTPHRGEMKRLLKDSTSKSCTEKFLIHCQQFAKKQKTTLVLKGGPSFIFQNKEPILISPFGDPGMATAGCGDILTGILAALLAQNLSPYKAAILGVALHGLAGIKAASEKGSYSLIATDLLTHLPQVFKQLSF